MRHLTTTLAAYLIVFFVWWHFRLSAADLLGYLGIGLLWALTNHFVVWRYQPDHPWHDVARDIFTQPAWRNLALLGGVVGGLPYWPLGMVVSAGLLLGVGAARLMRR
jgi:hypothetical protein